MPRWFQGDGGSERAATQRVNRPLPSDQTRRHVSRRADGEEFPLPTIKEKPMPSGLMALQVLTAMMMRRM